MIFIITGTQNFQFDRLLKEVDVLNKEQKISGKIFAQIGYSTYQPKSYDFVQFLSFKDFNKFVSTASFIITHGGSAAITASLKANKKVIAVPRLLEFGEHVDNHQLEIVNKLHEEGFISKVLELEHLEDAIKSIKSLKFNQFKSNPDLFLKSIKNDIDTFSKL